MHSSTPEPSDQPTPGPTVGHSPVQPAAVGPDADVAPRPPRSWRAIKGRRLVAAGAVVAGLAIGGAGFGAGYAVGNDGAGTTSTTDQSGLTGRQGFPGGPMGDRDGGGPPMGGTTGGSGGTTGQAPDFDGDGQPDTDSGSGTGSGSGSTSGTDPSSQNS